MSELLSHARSVLWMCPLIGVATVAMGTISLLSSAFDSTGALQHQVWPSTWARMLLRICMVKRGRDRRPSGSTRLRTTSFARITSA